MYLRKKKNGFSQAALLALLILAPSGAAAQVGGGEYELAEILARRQGPSYGDYRSAYPSASFTGETVTLSPAGGSGGETEITRGRTALVLRSGGRLEWAFTVSRAGWYRVETDYYPVAGNGGRIECSAYIDGALPFKEAYVLPFNRVYADEGPIVQNARGDDIRPRQIPRPAWLTANLHDQFLYYGEALYFYFSAGDHVLQLRSGSEALAIGEIRLVSQEIAYPSYDEYLAAAKKAGAVEASGLLGNGILKVQAENAVRKSDATLYPVMDNSSAANEPHSNTARRLNVVGGTRWKDAGQAITWEIEVPAAGLYTIGFRSKQNVYRDMYSNRALYIDGKIPFAGAAGIVFTYSDKWKITLAAEGKTGGGEPYLFYLKKGRREISLEAVLGQTAGIVSRGEAILAELNAVTFDFLTVMGGSPDIDRDYMLEYFMPDTVENIGVQRDRLRGMRGELLAVTGRVDSAIAQLDQLIFIMGQMVDQTDRIPALFSSYRSQVGTFASWMNTAREKPLLLDYLFIAEDGTKLPRAEKNFFETLLDAAGAFFASFVTNYSYLSEGETNPFANTRDKKGITVWIGSGISGGRDQALELNRQISEDFTVRTGIPVTLQLVSPGTILPAVLAGKGPDAALQIGGGDPVNWAMRNAARDLSSFPDFQEIAKRFHPQALVPFEYRGGYYALPETFSFPVMFYREDILAELGLTAADFAAWDGVLKAAVGLQRRNMAFGLGSDLGSFSMFLYQFGGRYYRDGYGASDLDSPLAVAAFTYWMDFYVNYGFEISFDFANRLRRGEMPIGVADYSGMYNLLSVSAPEIKGQWKMAPVPGRPAGDGTIDNTAALGVSGSVILSTSKNASAAWEFLKWWTSADTQYAFGRELESVMGPAARYNTANLEALARFSWSSADRAALFAQMEHLSGVPEVPGGYYTSRYIDFAKTAVYNRKENPKSVLFDYVDEINLEITQKRIEFGLE